MAKISDIVRNKINKLPKGYIFTYRDFLVNEINTEAVIKSLNRMASSGEISKLAKGKFYKPEKTPFGELIPDQSEIVKDLLGDSKTKITGYLTGQSIYHKLGLSTQVSNTIQIGTSNSRPTLKRGNYKITFSIQKNIITKENIPLLQILDSIKNFKKIPDASPDAICKRFQMIINNLSETEINNAIRLSMKYPPSARALLGALIDHSTKSISTTNLFESLNPITSYDFNISEDALPTVTKWNIR
jgi:hypothetical protein